MEPIQWQQRFESWLDEHHASEDSAHDISHFRRVWMTARKIMIHHQADPLVVLTACYFHDIVSLPKNHPERSQSSRLAVRKTRDILRRDFPDFPPDRFAAVEHAIEAHSFSAGIAPQSIEAKIVQDADRLEALGAIGLARVFAVSGGWAWHCLTRKIPLPMRARWMTGHLPSIIFRLSCCACLIQCKPTSGASSRNITPIFSFTLWRNSVPNYRATASGWIARFNTASVAVCPTELW